MEPVSSEMANKISFIGRIYGVYTLNKVIWQEPKILIQTRKIPHTGDTESLDRCGSSDRYFFLEGGVGKKKRKKRKKKKEKKVTHDM